ncbi:MAG TPA: DUF397 domain-containing protein [Streptosporangiaceae bacterium]
MTDDGPENGRGRAMNLLVWRKSTKSAQSDCVEVAKLDDAVYVRDSKDRRGPVLAFTAHQWHALLSDINSDH